MNQQKVAELIHEECAAIAALLTEKNRKYGNAVIEPVSIFSSSSVMERINVRIDDKLQRMANRQSDEDEDVEKDLIGYLLYRRVARRLMGKPVEWPEDETRIDVIGSNGNDGLAYQP